MADGQRPNILVIWGDDIGITNLSCYSDGLMGYRTPNIDRIAAEGPRPGFVYFSDDGDLVALRFDNFKLVFMEQRCPGTLQIWAEPFVTLRLPKLFNLRTDPFERADVTSNTYWDFLAEHEYIPLAAQPIIGMFLETFREFPPRQKAASFTIDQALDKLQASLTAHR
jgi:arylsulfatase A-like enzyme